MSAQVRTGRQSLPPPQAISQVAAGVAHDVNNLLTLVLGHASLLEATLPAADTRREDVEAISMAAERAAGMMAQLLAISRGADAGCEPFDPRERLGRLSGTLRHLLPAAVALVCDVAPGDGMVRLPAAQFDQLVLNLAVNAREAMPAGGRLTIRLRDEASSLVLEATDTGVGMDDLTARRCFEPYFSTKGDNGGTGLGLATVTSVVAGAGGRIDLDTAPGRGATFTVRLPACRLAATSRA